MSGYRIPRGLMVGSCILMATGLVAGILWARSGPTQGESTGSAITQRSIDDREWDDVAEDGRMPSAASVLGTAGDGKTDGDAGMGYRGGDRGGDVLVCPLEVPGGVLTERKNNGLGRSWVFTTEEGADAIAVATLDQLQERGSDLVEATQLDLFGDAWGCVAREEGVIILVFSRTGSPDPGAHTTTVSVIFLEPR